MSTEINSRVSDRVLSISGFVSSMSVRIDGEGMRYQVIDVPTADFLAAIEAEGIGVVVEGTLPKVTVMSDNSVRVDNRRFYREARDADLEYSLAIIAAHRHFDANPPVPEVDEADVEALVEGICEVDPFGETAIEIARHLLASGRVTVTR